MGDYRRIPLYNKALFTKYPITTPMPIINLKPVNNTLAAYITFIIMSIPSLPLPSDWLLTNRCYYRLIPLPYLLILPVIRMRTLLAGLIWRMACILMSIYSHYLLYAVSLILVRTVWIDVIALIIRPIPRCILLVHAGLPYLYPYLRTQLRIISRTMSMLALQLIIIPLVLSLIRDLLVSPAYL